MIRSNPYEAAFEAYLQRTGLCYVAVDESRRSFLGNVSVKNLDFIVLGAAGSRLLVDVKGRQFPTGPVGKERYVWENWSTLEDIAGLESWIRLFGSGYHALFVFLYRLQPTIEIPADTPDLWTFRDARYLLRAVALEEYRRHMRVRSPKWGTVSLPGAKFKELARPFRFYSHTLPLEAPLGPDQDWDLVESLRFAAQAGPHAGTQAAGRGA
ncbi:MAG: HYExAFE family protein [Gemmataceae bacterium]